MAMGSKAVISGAVIAVAMAPLIWGASARATTFSFNDEYFINGGGSTPNFTTTKNNANAKFGTINGVTTAGSGVYQGNGTCALGNCLGSTQVAKIGGRFGDVSGEWALNSGGFTNEFLATVGWTAAVTNGNQVDRIFNTNNPINGTNTYFQYQVGGAETAFTFNSFDLAGSFAGASLTFTLQGYLNNVLVDSAVLTVTGTALTTYTENWLNVDTIVIASTNDLPVNWGSGALYMDNVVINNSVPVQASEPASLALFGVGLLGFGAVIRRRRSAAI